ncbi:MAG: flavodoxin family protein [Spirochaetaceae bacterium]|jgi:multimeric flavodoxin WrbA|nr:flavodoxin family protein [Spirochaetaceae bacterium]
MKTEPKALALMGSPRAGGATARLLTCFIDQWRAFNLGAVTVVEAYKAALAPCTHCGYCGKQLGCVYDDGFTAIDAGLREADFLVVASPVYGMGFPAPLKAVFDRCQRYFEAKFSLGAANPIPKRKSALFLAAFGSKDGRGVEMMREQLRYTFLLVNAVLEKTVAAANTDRLPLDMEAAEREIQSAIRAAVSRWQNEGGPP